MKHIPLTKGYYAMVDDEDFPFLSQWKWYASVEEYTIYPKRFIQGRAVPMASVVLGILPGVEIDHRDHNGLNAQKRNLRIASRSQQTANQRLSCRNTSGFKGVFKVKNKSGFRWFAYIKINGSRKRLGMFDNPVKAAIAYDKAALKLFGEFAMTNRRMQLI